MERHVRRPDLRLAFAASRFRGSLWLRGFEAEVRDGLRRGLDQGDERGSVRSRLIHAEDLTDEKSPAGTAPRGIFYCAGSDQDFVVSRLPAASRCPLRLQTLMGRAFGDEKLDRGAGS